MSFVKTKLISEEVRREGSMSWLKTKFDHYWCEKKQLSNHLK